MFRSRGWMGWALLGAFVGACTDPGEPVGRGLRQVEPRDTALPAEVPSDASTEAGTGSEPHAATGRARPAPTLAHDRLVAEHLTTFTVTGVDAFSTVALLYSTVGASTGTCHASCVDLDSPVLQLGTVTADASGAATLEVVVPEQALGLPMYAQARVTVAGASGLTNISDGVVLPNQPPSVPTIELVPSAPRPGEPVSVAILADAVDPEGERVVYDMLWTRLADGLVVEGPVLDGAHTGHGDTWVVEVVPSDGQLVGPPVALDLAVVNDVPTVSDVTLVPAHPVAGEPVSCSWAWSDADGDPDLSGVRWLADGVEIGAGPSLAAAPAIGEVLSCEVTAHDGFVDGAVASRSVRIPSNVLILLMDDVGIDKIGLWGVTDEVPGTPAIDALAADGVLFRHAYTQPYCSPTRAAIQTGRAAHRTGVGMALSAYDDDGLPFAEETIPEMLDAGTGGLFDHSYIGKWHLGTRAAGWLDHPNASGWSYYAGVLNGISDEFTTDGLPQTYEDFELVENGVATRTAGYLTSLEVDLALNRTVAMQEPWVMMVGFGSAHRPWHEPPADLHSGVPVGPTVNHHQIHWMIEAIDAEVGRLLASIDPAVLSRTTVILMGDNGTKGAVAATGLDTTRMKSTLYEGGVRVPMIVSGPLVRTPGREVDAMVHAVDVFSTVADIAGAELDSAIERDGVSFLPYLRDPAAASARETVSSVLFEPPGLGVRRWYHDRMVRDARWKLISYEDHDELYDMDSLDYEGVDLLALGSLTPEQDDAYQRLLAALPPLDP